MRRSKASSFQSYRNRRCFSMLLVSDFHRRSSAGDQTLAQIVGPREASSCVGSCVGFMEGNHNLVEATHFWSAWSTLVVLEQSVRPTEGHHCCEEHPSMRSKAFNFEWTKELFFRHLILSDSLSSASSLCCLISMVLTFMDSATAWEHLVDIEDTNFVD